MLPRMGKWIKQPGERFETGDDGQARLTQVFHADRGQGVAEATRRGLARNARVFRDGRLLLLSSVNPATTESVDEVTLTWLGPAGAPEPPARNTILHEAGEEEWSLEAALENFEGDPKAFVNADGETIDLTQELGSATEPVRVPKLLLVWKKWLRPPWNRGPKDKPTALPKNKTDALKLFNCYGKAQDEKLETGGPRIGCVLDDSESGQFFLCVDLGVEPEGQLLCRTAKFEFSAKKYNDKIYPAP